MNHHIFKMMSISLISLTLIPAIFITVGDCSSFAKDRAEERLAEGVELIQLTGEVNSYETLFSLSPEGGKVAFLRTFYKTSIRYMSPTSSPP